MIAELPTIPDDDADFTPDLARKIIAKYQELLHRSSERTDATRAALRTALGQQADARLADALEIIKPFALLCDLDVKADQGDLDSVYPMVAVGRLRAARAFLDAVSSPVTEKTDG